MQVVLTYRYYYTCRFRHTYIQTYIYNTRVGTDLLTDVSQERLLQGCNCTCDYTSYTFFRRNVFNVFLFFFFFFHGQIASFQTFLRKISNKRRRLASNYRRSHESTSSALLFAAQIMSIISFVSRLPSYQASRFTDISRQTGEGFFLLNVPQPRRDVVDDVDTIDVKYTSRRTLTMMLIMTMMIRHLHLNASRLAVPRLKGRIYSRRYSSGVSRVYRVMCIQ